MRCLQVARRRFRSADDEFWLKQDLLLLNRVVRDERAQHRA